MDDDNFSWDGIRRHFERESLEDDEWGGAKRVHSWSLDFDSCEPPTKLQLDNLTGDASVESDSATKQTTTNSEGGSHFHVSPAAPHAAMAVARAVPRAAPTDGSGSGSGSGCGQEVENVGGFTQSDSDLADVRSLFLSALSEPASPSFPTDEPGGAAPTYRSAMPSDAPLSLDGGFSVIQDGDHHGLLVDASPPSLARPLESPPLDALSLEMQMGLGLGLPSDGTREALVSYPYSGASTTTSSCGQERERERLAAWSSGVSPTPTSLPAAGATGMAMTGSGGGAPSPATETTMSPPPQRHLSSVVKHHFNKQGLAVRGNGVGNGLTPSGSSPTGYGVIVGVLGNTSTAAGTTTIGSGAAGAGASLDLSGGPADPFLRSTASVRSASSVTASEHSMSMFCPPPTLSSSPPTRATHGMGALHLAATHTNGIPVGSPDVLSLSSSFHAPPGMSAEMLLDGVDHTPRVLYSNSPPPPPGSGGAMLSLSSSPGGGPQLSRGSTTNLAATYTAGVIPPSALQHPHQSSSSAALPASGYLSVVDPQRRKLQLPTSAIRHTKALVGRLTTPSLCLLYQAGRCRQGANCYQVHAEPDVVSTLRIKAEQQVCCCAIHGDANGGMWNVSEHAHRSISIGRVLISLEHLAYTTGLMRVLTDDRQTVPVNPSLLCRLQEHPTSCRYGADCRFLHVCREVLSASSISATGNGASATSGSHNGSLHPLHSSSTTLHQTTHGGPPDRGNEVNTSFSASHLLTGSTSSLGATQPTTTTGTGTARETAAAAAGLGGRPGSPNHPPHSSHHQFPMSHSMPHSHHHSPSLSLVQTHQTAPHHPEMSGSFSSQQMLGSESSFHGFNKQHLGTHSPATGLQANGSRAMSPVPSASAPAFIGAVAGTPMAAVTSQPQMFFPPNQRGLRDAGAGAGMGMSMPTPAVPQYVIQQVNSDGSVTFVPLQLYRDPLSVVGAAGGA